MRGPKPKPAGVREQLEPVRSKRKGRPPEAAHASPATGPVAPDWLEGDALEEWKRRAPTLAAAKLLGPADVAAFARYCANFARWLGMFRKLQEEGEYYVVESPHGTYKRPHPLGARIETLELRLVAAEDRFGMNPAERQRIMAARAQTGVSGDLFASAPKADTPRPAEVIPGASPIGLLN
ncbi:phage terminase small subunit P27 family [Phenylobacterium sp.]|uniref:phage terminase small subunit P27 family n=1 Tax=Phenylobacterium sp. TaxID=1871053 RepID=UPI0035B08DE6